MRLLRVRIQNFRSFKKQQTFELPQEAGLYFMSGVNESEPRLDANGAGKTTIWEAITWCFHGKTSKGLKAGDVSNWDAGKGTKVEIDYLTEADEPRTVMRSWGPIKHTLRFYDGSVEDLGKDDTNAVLQDLALPYQPFLNCILLAQGQPMFLDLKSTAQAELFSDVMGLDRWLDYSAKASKLAAAADADAAAQEVLLARAEGKLESTAGLDLQASLEAWEAKRQNRLHDLEFAYEQAQEHSTAKEKLEDATAAYERARKHLQDHAIPEDRIQNFKKAGILVTELLMLLKIEERARDEANERLELAETGKACPTCGAMPKAADHQEHIRRAMKEFRRLDDQCRNLDIQYEEARSEEAGLRALLEQAMAVESNARESMADAADDVAAARRDLAQHERELDRMEDEAEDIEAEVNPYADAVARQKKEGRRLRDEVEDLQQLVDGARSRQSRCAYWVRGFKELRLSLIAEALTELEIEVNSSCQALGLIGWELKFQVDRETKGGSISRGFSVLVQSPSSERAVPWEAWSGGETQRLRLAAQMGLADLIRARTGATLPLEVWDEPTRDLSNQGVQDLLDCLAERAIREDRQIWLVDHHTHAYGAFAGGATIVKTPGGSLVRPMR